MPPRAKLASRWAEASFLQPPVPLPGASCAHCYVSADGAASPDAAPPRALGPPAASAPRSAPAWRTSRPRPNPGGLGASAGAPWCLPRACRARPAVAARDVPVMNKPAAPWRPLFPPGAAPKCLPRCPFARNRRPTGRGLLSPAACAAAWRLSRPLPRRSRRGLPPVSLRRAPSALHCGLGASVRARVAHLAPSARPWWPRRLGGRV